MALNDELTDQLRGPIAALLDVQPEEIEEIQPVAYRVQVKRVGAHKSETRYHRVELS